MKPLENYLKEIFTFECHSDVVDSIIFSPDSSLALSGSRDGSVYLLDLTAMKILNTFEHKAPVKVSAFSENGKKIITFSDDKLIHIWDRDSFSKIDCFPVLGSKIENYNDKLGKKYILSAAFSFDGTQIILGCQDKICYLLPVSPNAKSRRLIGHILPVFGVGFAGKDNIVYSFSQWPDTTLKLWNSDTQKEIHCLKESDHILNAAVSSDIRYAVTSLANGKNHVWDLQTGKLLFKLSPRFLMKESLSSFNFHKDNSLLLAGSFDGIIKLWDIQTRKQLAKSKVHDGAVNQVVVSPDGSLALSSGEKDHRIKVWEIID